MKIELDEVQSGHIYSALGVAGNEWQKVKKSLAKLNKEDPTIDAEIALNAHLRKLFNPRAEEEARATEQAKRDAAQLDLTDPNYTGSSGETGGGAKAGGTFPTKLRLAGDEKPPTDEVLRDALLLADRMVLLSDIRSMTSSERDAAVAYASSPTEREDRTIDAEEPECIALVALSQARIHDLLRMGPHVLSSVYGEGVEPGGDPVSTKIVLPATKDTERTVVAEFVDEIEAEVKCARLNLLVIKTGGMDLELVERWLAAGPWSIMAEPVGGADRWYVAHEEQREAVRDMEEARVTAALYNRTVAGRDGDGNWREPPVKISDDAVQEIKAAAEVAGAEPVQE